MTDDALQIEIDGHTYLFRLEDSDVKEIERSLSLFVAFHPSNMTYENAARFLQHGLRKRKDDKLVYIFAQDETGRDPAFQYVKKFCKNFNGVDGIVLLYGFFNKALIELEWRADPYKKKEETTEVPIESIAPEKIPKNSAKPTSGLMKKLRSVFVA